MTLRHSRITRIGLGALLTVAMARGEEPLPQVAIRKVNSLAADGNLKLSFSYRDLIDAGISQKLTSGFPVVLATRVYLLREGEVNALGLSVRTCKVTYDLWEEVYRIHISFGGVERDLAVLNYEGVVRQCLEYADATLFPSSQLRPGAFLGVIAEVNPMSKDLQKELRAWVARPAGATGIAPGDALFGTFVSLFTQKAISANAERTLRFRSQVLVPRAP
jgi:hypothetical protein